MKEPVWHSIGAGAREEAKHAKAIREGRELAHYIHGPEWSAAHDNAVRGYLKMNGFSPEEWARR